MTVYYFYCKVHGTRGSDTTEDAAAREMRDHILGVPSPHDVNVYQMYTNDLHGRPLTRVRKVRMKQ